MFGKNTMNTPWAAISLKDAAQTAKKLGYDAVMWDGQSYCTDCSSQPSASSAEFGSCLNLSGPVG